MIFILTVRKENTMPALDMIQTGLNIRNRMNLNNVSVRDVQNIFGFNTPSCIYRWLNGASMPTLDNLIVLVDFLHCDLNDIISVKRI